MHDNKYTLKSIPLQLTIKLFFECPMAMRTIYSSSETIISIKVV